MTYTGQDRRENEPGRREADRNVCVYHDICHETVANIQQNCKDHLTDAKERHREMDKLMDTKVPNWVFRSAFSTLILILIAAATLMAPKFFDMADAVIRIDTNQQHLMEEFRIKPVAE